MKTGEILKSHLPSCLYCLYENTPGLEEIRMRKGCQVLIKDQSGIRSTALIFTEELMAETLVLLTSHSYYMHTDTIREGYISLEGGIRVGVVGTAVTDEESIISVNDISFLSIRIPRAVSGAADPLIGRMSEKAFKEGALIYSLPGVGKTTVLREFARFTAGKLLLSTALIDTRNELSTGLDDCPALSVYRSYPKAMAVEIAIRTACPEIVILDEIGEKESRALIGTAPSGIPIVASAHAKCMEDLKARPGIGELINAGVFGIFCRLTRTGKKTEFQFSSPSQRKGGAI